MSPLTRCWLPTVMAFCMNLLVSTTARAAEPSRLDKLLDAFTAAIHADKDLPADRVQKADEQIATLRATLDGQSIALTEALCELYPAYRTALTALAEENLDAAQQTLTKLRGSDQPFLKTDASYFLARTYLMREQFEQALPLLAELLTDYTDKNPRPGETLFLKGVAEVQLLHHQQATESLQTFLTDYPEAPERMRVGAFRQLEQLKLFKEGTLSDVHLRMDFSRRRLALEDPGKETRAQQDKIVDILAKLIKEAEERECSGQGSGSGSGQKKQQGKGSEGESQAQGDGSSQGGNSGGGSKGIDSDAVKRLHRGGPRSPWSNLRDKERDPVFNAIKEKYPARYQQLIEQYYRSFDELPGEG